MKILKDKTLPKKKKFIPPEEKYSHDASLFGDMHSVAFLDLEEQYADFSETISKNSSEVAFFDQDPSKENVESDNIDPSKYECCSDLVTQHPPIDVTVCPGETITVCDLSDIYPAGDLLSAMGMLHLEVAENTNPDLVSPKINNIFLTLVYNQEETGEADVLVRGTYLDGKVYDSPFHIQKNPSTFTYDTSAKARNPWLPWTYREITLDLEAKIIAFGFLESPLEFKSANSPEEESQSVINEISGFFGKSSLEEGCWVNSEIKE